MSLGRTGLVPGAVVLATMLAACTGTPTDPVTVLADGSASAVTLNETFPFFSGNSFGGCLGESLEISGTVHRVLIITLDSSPLGGSHLGQKVTLYDLTAVGNSSGTVYRGSVNGISTFNHNSHHLVQRFHTRLRFVATKTGDVLLVRTDFGFVDQNGENVLEIDFRIVECR